MLMNNLKKGEKVRRDNWDSDYYIYIDSNRIIASKINIDYCVAWGFRTEDILYWPQIGLYIIIMNPLKNKI